MEIRGLAFLPILWVIWTLSGLYALLALTVISGHNKQPFIRDTGIEFPDWVIYKVVFMVTSILGAGIASIQYRFMILQSEPSEKRYIICQRILYAMGWISSIGTALNAIFTMRSNPLIHRIGAVSAFFCCVVYNISQALYLYRRSFSSRLMCHIRLAAILVTGVVLLICSIGMSAITIELCTGRCQKMIYVPNIATEYIGFSGLVLYQLTKYTDFQHLSMKLSRKGIFICLREKTMDPENPK